MVRIARARPTTGTGAPSWNDRISSVKPVSPPPANKLDLWQHFDCTGATLSIPTAGEPDLRKHAHNFGGGKTTWNDQASGYKCTGLWTASEHAEVAGGTGKSITLA
eukprot:143613_1